MPLYKIMDLCMDIRFQYAVAEELCTNYLLLEEQDAVPHLMVSVPAEDIRTMERKTGIGEAWYLESLCVFKEISQKIIPYQGFALHAAVVAVNNEAYAFSADSGVGKSTLANFFEKNFGGQAIIINGDKPLVREVNGDFMVYGTPWCGKEGKNLNISVSLVRIVFLERGDCNKVTRITSSEAAQRIFRQVMLPKDWNTLSKLLNLLDQFLLKTPSYIFQCNKDELMGNIMKRGREGVRELWEEFGK